MHTLGGPAAHAVRLTFLVAPLFWTGAVHGRQADPKPRQAPVPPATYKSLDALLAPIRAAHDLPALAAAVIRNGRLEALGAVGVRKVGLDEPVRVDDKFHIGSCTKSMTATLCAMLVEDGKLSWATTLGETFPELKDKIRPAYHGVTLEQLLCHRSGLPEDRTPNAVFFKLVALRGDIRKQRRQMVELLLQQEPANPPGEAFAYSNGGVSIAGAMAEAVSEKSWEELIRQRLFEPLGMKSAGFGPPGSAEADPPDQPWGHRAAGAKPFPMPPGRFADNPAVIGPAGTVHLSMEDWARYAIAHLKGAHGSGTLLKPESFKTLHTDKYNQQYAFGWGISQPPWTTGKVLEHAGSNSLWFARIHLLPEHNWGVLLATNQANEAAQQALQVAFERILKRYPTDPGGK